MLFRMVLACTLAMVSASLTACTVPPEELEDICNREEISPAERELLRKRPDFDEILDYALEFCPEIALQLVSPATETILDDQGFKDGGGGTFPSGGGDDGDGDDGDGPTDPPSFEETPDDVDADGIPNDQDDHNNYEDEPQNGNASANNGKGGNYEKTGQNDNGRGRGRDSK